eukprot:gene7090-9675_t
MEFINTQISLYPDIGQSYVELLELYDRKLWHQLSISLESFLGNPSNNRGNNIVELYTNFIVLFDTRLNQVKLAQLVSLIADSLIDPTEALQFVSKLLESRKRLGVEASLCLDMDLAVIYIKLGDIENARSIVDSAKEQISSIQSTEAVVFSKYYYAMLTFTKIVGPAKEFYNSSLMYLAYTPVESLSTPSQFTLATDMAVAAITGDDIYNFGEVIATPILNYLKGTSNEWLHDLVHAMNNGDVENFNGLLKVYSQQYSAIPALANSQEIVKQKIVLLCLINIIFERPSHDRQISFADISRKTQVPNDQVEWVLMKAMSLGLIKGIIDEVESNVSVTWIQPRVLGKNQLALLSEQLDNWTERVKQTLKTVEDQTPELLYN